MTPLEPEALRTRQALSVLIVSTLAFTVCFMVWMMFGVIGIPIRKALNLNATEFGLLTATPVLTGSLIRVPLGIWTDRYGGRIVMAILMALTVPAIWLMAYATQFWHFIVIGLFVGLAGGSFSVGTPYVARWFPKNRQGFAMGVYGAGNSGAAVNKFVAPALVVAFGWTLVPQVYAAIMLGTVTVAVRGMASTESPQTLLIWQLTTVTFFHAFLLFFGVKWAPPQDLALFALGGITNLIGQYFWTKALVLAPATAVSPFFYFMLVWAMVIGYLVWGEVPTSGLLAGSGIVIASGLFLLWHEARRRRRAKITA